MGGRPAEHLAAGLGAHRPGVALARYQAEETAGDRSGDDRGAGQAMMRLGGASSSLLMMLLSGRLGLVCQRSPACVHAGLSGGNALDHPPFSFWRMKSARGARLWS